MLAHQELHFKTGAEGIGGPACHLAWTLLPVAMVVPFAKGTRAAVTALRGGGSRAGRRDASCRRDVPERHPGTPALPLFPAPGRDTHVPIRMEGLMTTASPNSPDDPQVLVSTDWLSRHLKSPDLRVLDASWYLPDAGRDPKADYAQAHIPGARFFDIDEISDHRSELPHMAPPVEKFMSRLRAMGVGDGHQVVVYDGAGLMSAARVWWLFRLMGQRNVAVLDGGLPKWRAEGRPVTDDDAVIRDRHMTVTRQNHLVRDVTEVARAAKLGDHAIIDARAPARFAGEAPEPRAGLRAGHIPGSRNVFYRDLLNDDFTMKPPADLRRIFEAAGVDLAKPAITTCGSGVTAAVLSLALERIGKTDHSLYDGSWSEWGMYDDLPIEAGPAA